MEKLNDVITAIDDFVCGPGHADSACGAQEFSLRSAHGF